MDFATQSTAEEMPDLKLIAMDADDLAVLSAHFQDAVLRAGDLAYLKSEKRFALVANRFDWAGAVKTEGRQHFQRRRAGLHFDRVQRAQLHGLNLADKDTTLELLAVCWEPAAEPPAGLVTLHFAGGGAIRLHVECIEAEMRDLGAAWETRSKPDHPDTPAGRSETST